MIENNPAQDAARDAALRLYSQWNDRALYLESAYTDAYLRLGSIGCDAAVAAAREQEIWLLLQDAYARRDRYRAQAMEVQK